MTLTTLALFASTFAVVFAYGLQSQLVNNGHYAGAFTNSFAIGTANLILLKLVPGETSAADIAAYLLGGPFGIVASMLVYRIFWKRKL